MSTNIAYKLDHLLNKILYEYLSQWLQPKLIEIHGTDKWWSTGVYFKLSELDRKKLSTTQDGGLSMLDLQAVLKVCSGNSLALNNRGYISRDFRTPLESIKDARNALSHRRGGDPPSTEDLFFYALNTRKLLTLIDAPEQAVSAADEVINFINNPGEISAPVTPPIAEPVPEMLDKKEQNESVDILEDDDSIHIKTTRSDVDPTREPTEGLNSVVTAILEHCAKLDDHFWDMTFLVKSGDADEYVSLKVPEYLENSAEAASDILDSVQLQRPVPEITVKLLNITYRAGEFHFPEDLSEVGDQYPMLIVQPSYLVNVTALTHFDFCPRNYLMDRYSIPETNQAMQRGSLVHSMFDFMLKNPNKREGLIEHCHTTLDRQLPDLAMQNIPPAEHYDDVKPHLNALARGVKETLETSSFKDVVVERYMINPDLGLKGKIDALVKKANGKWQAIELKTGTSWGAKARAGHAFQVSAYHLLLEQAGIDPLDPPCVFYTGDMAKEFKEGEVSLRPSSMIKQLPFTAETAIEIMNLRNELVRIDYTGSVIFNSNSNKCRACVRLGKAPHCIHLHKLGLEGGDDPSVHLDDLLQTSHIGDAHFKEFQMMNRALLEEFRTVRTEHGQSLQGSIMSREAKGVCLPVKCSNLSVNEGSLELVFPRGNSSEFREGDPCLLSDADGPVHGNCIEVYISSINKTKAVVTLPQGVESLWFEPSLLDSNAPDAAFERNFGALYALWACPETSGRTLGSIRRFLSGESETFSPNQVVPCSLDDLDPQPLPTQQRAVELAMGLKDILLIQGPPGTGKTYTLALIVKALAKKGKRIAIATYTHRASDEVLNKLESIAPEVKVRKLGRIEAVSAQHGKKCLNQILDREDTNFIKSNRIEMLKDLESRYEELSEVLSAQSVYVGTTHAWLSGKHDSLPGLMADGESKLFDVVIVDEASQVITPNLIGALRLAEKWILIGDHKQLPPIVVGDTTGVLEKTLFEKIAEQAQGRENLLVQLDTQHRMPPVLSDFIGQTFYGGNLRTAESCMQPSLSVSIDHPLMHPEHCIGLVNIPWDSNVLQIRKSKQEADWIADTLKTLIDSGWPLIGETGKPTIGIIAPYRAQVALLRRTLEKKLEVLGFGSDIWSQIVDTVDRFQGDERDIIVLSLCLNPEHKHTPRIYQCAIRFYWTVFPVLTGHRFRFELDSVSP